MHIKWNVHCTHTYALIYLWPIASHFSDHRPSACTIERMLIPIQMDLPTAKADINSDSVRSKVAQAAQYNVDLYMCIMIVF